MVENWFESSMAQTACYTDFCDSFPAAAATLKKNTHRVTCASCLNWKKGGQRVAALTWEWKDVEIFPYVGGEVWFLSWNSTKFFFGGGTSAQICSQPWIKNKLLWIKNKQNSGGGVGGRSDKYSFDSLYSCSTFCCIVELKAAAYVGFPSGHPPKLWSDLDLFSFSKVTGSCAEPQSTGPHWSSRTWTSP